MSGTKSPLPFGVLPSRLKRRQVIEIAANGVSIAFRRSALPAQEIVFDGATPDDLVSIAFRRSALPALARSLPDGAGAVRVSIAFRRSALPALNKNMQGLR